MYDYYPRYENSLYERYYKIGISDYEKIDFSSLDIVSLLSGKKDLKYASIAYWSECKVIKVTCNHRTRSRTLVLYITTVANEEFTLMINDAQASMRYCANKIHDASVMQDNVKCLLEDNGCRVMSNTEKPEIVTPVRYKPGKISTVVLMLEPIDYLSATSCYIQLPQKKRIDFSKLKPCILSNEERHHISCNSVGGWDACTVDKLTEDGKRIRLLVRLRNASVIYVDIDSQNQWAICWHNHNDYKIEFANLRQQIDNILYNNYFIYSLKKSKSTSKVTKDPSRVSHQITIKLDTGKTLDTSHFVTYSIKESEKMLKLDRIARWKKCNIQQASYNVLSLKVLLLNDRELVLTLHMTEQQRVVCSYSTKDKDDIVLSKLKEDLQIFLDDNQCIVSVPVEHLALPVRRVADNSPVSVRKNFIPKFSNEVTDNILQIPSSSILNAVQTQDNKSNPEFRKPVYHRKSLPSLSHSSEINVYVKEMEENEILDFSRFLTESAGQNALLGCSISTWKSCFFSDISLTTKTLRLCIEYKNNARIYVDIDSIYPYKITGRYDGYNHFVENFIYLPKEMNLFFISNNILRAIREREHTFMFPKCQTQTDGAKKIACFSHLSNAKISFSSIANWSLCYITEQSEEHLSLRVVMAYNQIITIILYTDISRGMTLIYDDYILAYISEEEMQRDVRQFVRDNHCFKIVSDVSVETECKEKNISPEDDKTLQQSASITVTDVQAEEKSQVEADASQSVDEEDTVTLLDNVTPIHEKCDIGRE